MHSPPFSIARGTSTQPGISCRTLRHLHRNIWTTAQNAGHGISAWLQRALLPHTRWFSWRNGRACWQAWISGEERLVLRGAERAPGGREVHSNGLYTAPGQLPSAQGLPCVLVREPGLRSRCQVLRMTDALLPELLVLWLGDAAEAGSAS